MARRRFFVDAIRDGTAELRGDDARHLTRVLRVEPGQRLRDLRPPCRLPGGDRGSAAGDRVMFRVLEPVESTALPLRVTLCAALIKFDRFEWMVEKATELGVERIVPVEAARSGKRSLRSLAQARRAMGPDRPREQPAIPAAAGARDPPGGALRARASEKAAEFRYFLEEAAAPAPVADAAGKSARRMQPRRCWSDRRAAGRTPNAKRASAAGWQPVSLGHADSAGGNRGGGGRRHPGECLDAIMGQ